MGDSTEVLDTTFISSVEEEVPDSNEPLPTPAPSMTDPGWHEYVMGHFEPGELDPEGRPLVHGLRRVAHLLLGPIIESEPEVVQSPTFLPGLINLSTMTPAVVKYRIKILMTQLDPGQQAAYHAVFGEVADVHYFNCDQEFLRYATAMAATRAEARCLRKALRLKTVSAEEVTTLPVPEINVGGEIDDTQKTFLNMICARNDINVMKFVNMGKKRYSSIDDIPYEIAQKMLEHLNSLQREPHKIPPEIKGYEG